MLAGFFPLRERQKWNESLIWQPIPVHTVPQHRDYHLALRKQCHQLDYSMIQYLNTTVYKILFEKYQPLIKYLEVNSGQNLTTLTAISTLYNTLYIEKSKGFWYDTQFYSFNSEVRNVSLKSSTIFHNP